MTKQILWNKEQFILHNCKWEPITVETNSSKISLNKLKTEKLSVELKPELEPIITANKIDYIPVKNEEPKQEDSRVIIRSTKRITMHCLEIEEYDFKDEFYGETRKKVKFGKHFTVETVILSISDLSMTFWSKINLGKNSITYPSNFEKRWWQISDVELIEDGYIYNSVPANLNPSFENCK
jgi:hypothetical protein